MDEIVLLKGGYIKNKLISPSQVESYNPFFIISPGRSGSTFLRKQIMSTGQVNIPPESYQCIPESIKYYIRNHSKKWELLVHDILGIFMGNPGFKFWNIDLHDYEKELSNIDENARTLFKILDYIYRLHTKIHAPGAGYYGDKTPLLAMNLKWLDLLFFNSKYIFLYRDPVDIIHSRMFNFGEPFNQALKRVRWSLREMYRFIQEKKNSNIFRIQYEETVREPSASILKIFDFLGIMPTGNEPGNVHLGDDILKHHIHVEKPVTTEFIGKGYKFLTEHQVKMIKEETNKYMWNGNRQQHFF